MTEEEMTIDSLLSLLNKAVARELQVSIQYMLQHTLFAEKKELETDLESSQQKRMSFIGSHSPLWFPGTSLKKIAITEMRHAETVAERIVALGEIPTTKPEPVALGESLHEMIEINREAENVAIQLYTQIIDMAEKLGDEATSRLFQQILVDEKDHLNMFNNMLE